MRARALLATIFAVLINFPTLAEEAAGDEAPVATVLCYHIVESPNDERMYVSRETFRQHLDYLSMTGYNVIPLQHLSEYVTGKRESIPKNAVVITIDDGWRSAYTEAFPELKKRGLPFTLFIYPKIIGNTAISLSWDQVREMSEAGADIQSHSLSHPFLTRGRQAELGEKEYSSWLYRELSESRRIIEKHTGKKVQFLAYPYGDYDTRVAAMASKTGYAAALTCDFGRVRRGSNPHRMKRFVIDKRMDFAEFRHYMGATRIRLAEMTPVSGRELEDADTVVSARITNHEALDPRSVGMALITLGETTPYSYDARTGSISLLLNDAAGSLRGKYHRAVVWAIEARTGRRVEATWTFRVPLAEKSAARKEPERPSSVSLASTPILGGGRAALSIRSSDGGGSPRK